MAAPDGRASDLPGTHNAGDDGVIRDEAAADAGAAGDSSFCSGDNAARQGASHTTCAAGVNMTGEGAGVAEGVDGHGAASAAREVVTVPDLSAAPESVAAERWESAGWARAQDWAWANSAWGGSDVSWWQPRDA